MTFKLGMQHRVLEYYQVCSNDDPGLTMPKPLPITAFCTKEQKVGSVGKHLQPDPVQKASHAGI